jgi:hypothetical protein
MCRIGSKCGYDYDRQDQASVCRDDACYDEIGGTCLFPYWCEERWRDVDRRKFGDAQDRSA